MEVLLYEVNPHINSFQGLILSPFSYKASFADAFFNMQINN